MPYTQEGFVGEGREEKEIKTSAEYNKAGKQE
jgi:hypothetical protein